MKQDSSTSIDTWLTEVRSHISNEAPELLPTFDVYSGEARFGREFIASDLEQLSADARILEVGAGSLLLSCQLVREGLNISSLEPIGSGFSHFEQLQDLVLNYANSIGISPILLEQEAETLTQQATFDYAFSVNVMEHVKDVDKVIINIGASLKAGAQYRFTCPNYSFPYEPHFNIPTFLSKETTERIFYNRIFKNSSLPDPGGTWESLNWINTRGIKKTINSAKALKVSFNKNMLVNTFERAVTDEAFASRRSKWICFIINGLVKFRLHKLVSFIPVSIQPIIDCTITKETEK